jgi:hypothetical protein
MRKEMVLTLLAGILAVQISRADDGPTNSSVADHNLAIAKRDAARKAYLAWWANYHDRAGPAEWVYIWSKRWLRAEKELSSKEDDQVAAYQGHLERMRELEGIVSRLQRAKAGLARIDEISSTHYYRVEAEIWYVESKHQSQGTKP